MEAFLDQLNEVVLTLQDFMSGKFDRTGFVCTYMSRLSRYNALIRL